jgi:uridine kinase
MRYRARAPTQRCGPFIGLDQWHVLVRTWGHVRTYVRKLGAMRPLSPASPPSPIPAALGGLAARLRSLPPSLGPVRLAAVDGHAGSGKTTFTERLAARLGGAPVLHLDDLASHADFFGWSERLERQVLAPLAEGREARHEVYDWERAEFRAGEGARGLLRPAPVVLIEGVGAGRRALRPYLACLLWMDVPAREAWSRGRLRDGPALSGFWSAWTRAERTHFAEDPSYSYANFVVRQGRLGYEVRAGRV